MKTNKSYIKRLKITKRGKILVRRGGKDHFNAKESRSTQLANNRLRSFPMKNKDLSRYQLPVNRVPNPSINSGQKK